LTVSLKADHTSLTAGLDRHGNFAGFVDLTVTVTDGVTRKPVEGADVTVVLGRTSGTVAVYPSGTGSGTGQVCTYLEAGGGCADNTLSGLRALKTDSDGTVKVVYFAPGLITSGKVVISANATAPASGTPCGCSERSGQAKPVTLSVMPHRVAIGNATLPNTDVLGLVDYVAPIDWAKIARGFAKDKAWEKVREGLLTKLIGEETAAFLSDPGLGAGLFIKDLVSEAAKEEREDMAVVLTNVGIIDSGLGYTPSDHPHNYASSSFVDAFVGTRTSPGMLWRLGEALEALEVGGDLAGSLQIGMKVYDVSYCHPGKTCDDSNGDGVEPYLDFQFTADRTSPGTTGQAQVLSDDLVQPFNPKDWLVAQRIS
jgi:hypothetical protein